MSEAEGVRPQLVVHLVTGKQLPRELEALPELRLRRPFKPVDRVGRRQLAQLAPYPLLSALPAIAGQFQKRVPVSHLEPDGVRCTCGALVELGELFTECGGGCLRFFWRLGEDDVRVAGPYPREEAA